jgi:hypothetical protein
MKGTAVKQKPDEVAVQEDVGTDAHAVITGRAVAPGVGVSITDRAAVASLEREAR